jgi:hypothetical protein
MKKHPSDRQIFEAIEAQLNAMLLFAVKGARPTRWEADNYLKGLVEIEALLRGEIDEWPVCEGCQKPIRARQAYVHSSDDGLWFHGRCCGLPASRCARMESPAYIRRELLRRAEAARAYLRGRGAIS